MDRLSHQSHTERGANAAHGIESRRAIAGCPIQALLWLEWGENSCEKPLPFIVRGSPGAR